MKQLIPAIQKDAILQKDIEKHQNTEGVHIWWLGQSGFLLVHKGKTILFDPYLSDSLTKKYENTTKPHVRMSEIAINPELLTRVDIVTSSHNHTDHLDAETLIPLLKVNPNIKFVIPEANRAFISNRVKCALDMPIGLSDGENIEIDGFKIIGVPAAHNTIERDENGRCKFMGFVVQFGKYSVYHSGDTLWYKEIMDILKPFNVDIAFLPINGNKPKRGVAGNLNATEAAALGKAIGAKCVIPHHYDMFKFNTANPEEFVKAAEKHQLKYKILGIGEGFSIV